jgi:hypothetical protein
MVARRSTRFDTTLKAFSIYPYARTQAERKTESCEEKHCTGQNPWYTSMFVIITTA